MACRKELYNTSLDYEALEDILLYMVLYINGEPREVKDELNLYELLDHLGIALREVGLAISVNGEVVPKSKYTDVRLKEGDSVEIIHLVGGG
jgi:sulfur carrier protein